MLSFTPSYADYPLLMAILTGRFDFRLSTSFLLDKIKDTFPVNSMDLLWNTLHRLP